MDTRKIPSSDVISEDASGACDAKNDTFDPQLLLRNADLYKA
jgi:hypothetical protein